MKNKKGFLAVSLIYSFFLVFIMVMVTILSKSILNRNLINSVKEDIRSDMDQYDDLDVGEIASGTYAAGTTLSFAGEDWIVVNDSPSSVNTVDLILARALNKAEVIKAIGQTPTSNPATDPYYGPDCTDEKCLVRLCRYVTAIDNGGSYSVDENKYYCYRFYGGYGIPASYAAPMWQATINNVDSSQSIISSVTQYWFNNNAKLKKAKNSGNLSSMQVSDGFFNFSTYIRLPTVAEANANGTKWNYTNDFQLWDRLNDTQTYVYFHDTVTTVPIENVSYIRPVIEVYKSTTNATNYSYTGSAQVFKAPSDGNYLFEAWGAQGGSTSANALGGKGGYTRGVLSLKQGDQIYVYVGGQGNNTTSGRYSLMAGGYNGGGNTGGQNCCGRLFGSGGGATDFRITGGAWNDATSLASRIMVAGGGGGAFEGYNSIYYYNAGGNAGGLIGGSGSQGVAAADQWCFGLGGTQTAGGAVTTACAQTANSYLLSGQITGSLGIGGQNNDAATGGGGGYYGGSRSGHIASAGGGSSYISGYSGCANASKVFSSTQMIDGGSTMPSHFNNGQMTGNTGNGFARITLIS